MLFEQKLLQKELANEAINEKVEKLTVGMSEKMETLLVLHNVKPINDFECVTTSQEQQIQFDENIKILKDLELSVHVHESDVHEDDSLANEKIMNVYFANKKETLDEFIDLQSKEDADILLGRAFGFPDTAIQAFKDMEGNGELPYDERNFMWRRELSDGVKQSEVYAYITFGVLSKEHWEEEIETAQRWMDKVKEVNTKFHKEYIKWAREEWLSDELE